MTSSNLTKRRFGVLLPFGNLLCIQLCLASPFVWKWLVLGVRALLSPQKVQAPSIIRLALVSLPNEPVPESHHITRMEARQEPLFFSGVVLFPGDSLPLRVLQPRFQGAVRRAMRQTTHACTIGVVSARNALLQLHFSCTVRSNIMLPPVLKMCALHAGL